MRTKKMRTKKSGWDVMDEVHAHCRQIKMSEREVMRLAEKALVEVRKQNAQRGR